MIEDLKNRRHDLLRKIVEFVNVKALQDEIEREKQIIKSTDMFKDQITWYDSQKLAFKKFRQNCFVNFNSTIAS